jgi:hypothetical protein
MEHKENHLLRLTLDGKELEITSKVLFRNLLNLKIRILKQELHFKLRELELLKLNLQLENQFKLKERQLVETL